MYRDRGLFLQSTYPRLSVTAVGEPPQNGNCGVFKTCAILPAAADRWLVYGRGQIFNEPPEPSVSKFAGLPANAVWRGGAGRVEDDPHRYVADRSPDQRHPPDRSSQRRDAVLNLRSRQRRPALALRSGPESAGIVPGSDRRTSDRP